LNESSNVPHVLNLKTLPLEPWKKTAFPVLFSGLGGSIPLQLPANLTLNMKWTYCPGEVRGSEYLDASASTAFRAGAGRCLAKPSMTMGILGRKHDCVHRARA